MTGTTATVCLLRDNIELAVGHVGDTRAILCREGEAIRLSHDHHPDDKSEANRIKAAGGHITENNHGVLHVNGRLTMTRSIGDFDLKPFGVTAAPFMRSIEVCSQKLCLMSNFLSHNNPCFPCNRAITNLLVLYTCEIRFLMSSIALYVSLHHDVILRKNSKTWLNEYFWTLFFHFSSLDSVM